MVVPLAVPLAAGEPLVLAAAAVAATTAAVAGWGGGEERVTVEGLFCDAMDWLLDLRVEPTSFLKRWFMDDM